ncbi:Prohibitin-2, partial [Sarcoptes scabiei]
IRLQKISLLSRNRFRSNIDLNISKNLEKMAEKLGEFMNKFGKKPSGIGLGAKILMGIGGLGYAATQSVYTVDGGHRAIIFSRIGGVQQQVYSEGLHFRIPWFQWPIIYDIRSRPRKLSSPTGSKDLQMVNISLRVLARPDASKLHKYIVSWEPIMMSVSCLPFVMKF